MININLKNNLNGLLSSRIFQNFLSLIADDSVQSMSSKVCLLVLGSLLLLPHGVKLLLPLYATSEDIELLVDHLNALLPILHCGSQLIRFPITYIVVND